VTRAPAAPPAPPAATAAGRGGGIVLLAALLLAAVALRPQLVGAGPLIPDIQDDLGVSHAVAGLVGTIPVLCMGLFAPVAGLVSARWGLRTAMAGCLALIALAGLARAAAPGIVLLLALTFPIGMAMAVAGTLLPVAVKQRFAHRPAFANGIGVTGINIGAAVSSAVAVPIAASSGGWRGALAAFSLAAAAISLGWLVLSRGAWSERSGSRPPKLPVRRPVAWMIVAAFALPSAVYYGLVSWIADVYQEHGWSDERSGNLLAVMGLAAIPAGMLVPWLADRVGSRRGWMGFATGCMAVATLGFAAIPGPGFLWGVFAGIALGTVFPMSLTMCLDVAHDPAEAGAAAALMFLAGYPFAALGPLGVGALRDLTGSFDASMWALFGVALLLAVALLPLTRARLRPVGAGSARDREG
jgi:MFS transporter, CP family, cyanate transporter